MSLRIETSADVAEIKPILRVLRGTLAEDVFDARLARAMRAGYSVLLARNDAGALGCLGYRLIDDVFWGKTLFVDDLVVDPDTRGQGVGSALLDAAKQEAAVQHCDHIRLCSGLTRHQAHTFYEQNGFERRSVQFAYAIPNGEI